ncbi:hypothetical protein ACI797_10600 [Geodermatophilus sp. SYSU D00691]
MRAASAGASLLLAAAVLAGCANGSTAIAAPPLCESGDDGAGNGVILMAQSVPTAEWIPCIRAALPLGWGFHHLEARNGGSRFWLNSDRDGQKAVEVRLAPSCDTLGATPVPSDREGMQRLERVSQMAPTYAGERFYLFDGGCLTFVFALHGDSPGEGLALVSQVVGVIAREDLQEQVREESGGRLELDPTGAP